MRYWIDFGGRGNGYGRGGVKKNNRGCFLQHYIKKYNKKRSLCCLDASPPLRLVLHLDDAPLVLVVRHDLGAQRFDLRPFLDADPRRANIVTLQVVSTQVKQGRKNTYRVRTHVQVHDGNLLDTATRPISARRCVLARVPERTHGDVLGVVEAVRRAMHAAAISTLKRMQVTRGEITYRTSQKSVRPKTRGSAAMRRASRAATSSRVCASRRELSRGQRRRCG